MDWEAFFGTQNVTTGGLIVALVAAIIKIFRLKIEFNKDNRADSKDAAKTYSELYEKVLKRLEEMESKYEEVVKLYYSEKNANMLLENSLRSINRKLDILEKENEALRKTIIKKENILVLEDNEVDQKFLKYLFKNMPSYELKMVTTIESALYALKYGNIACAIVDMQTKESDKAINEFDSFFDKIPFVVYTGNQYETSEMYEILSKGVVGYHNKNTVTSSLEMEKIIIEAMLWFNKKFELSKMNKEQIKSLREDLQNKFEMINAIIEKES